MGVLESSGPLAERPFRLLWLARTISLVGDVLVPIALAFAAIELSGSASALGLVLTAVLLPRLLLTLAGGVWADRLPRHRVMLVSNLIRAMSQATVAFLLMTETAELWHLLVTGAIYGMAAAFFDPASTGLVPQTVSADRLQQANALMNLTRSVLRVGGPAVSGVLIATVGTGAVFAIDAATFVVSACFLWLIRLEPVVRAPRQSFVRELADGWREVRARSWVWTSILYFSFWNLAIAVFFVLGPLVAERELGGASDWGLIMTGLAAGAIIGNTLALRLRPDRPLLAAYSLIVLAALPPALLARPFAAGVVAVGTAIAFCAASISNVLWTTTLQANVPDEALSRVASYEWVGSFVAMPVGYLLAGPLSGLLGTDVTLIVSAAMLLASTFAMLAIPSVRGVRVQDEARLRATLAPAAR